MSDGPCALISAEFQGIPSFAQAGLQEGLEAVALPQRRRRHFLQFLRKLQAEKLLKIAL